MVGVGGAGMCGIAEILANLGFEVSGSDLNEGDVTRGLREAGVEVSIGHDSANLGDAEVVVISTAIPKSNPEVIAAYERNLPVIRRAEMLAELMRMKTGVAICGTHGKTTTTSILAEILAAAGKDPTYVIGGKLNSAGRNARLGEGDLLIAEADESDGSFLQLSPVYAVLTNVNADHLDFYGDFDAVKEAFTEFINKLPFYGEAIICTDDPGVRDIKPHLQRRYTTYGSIGNPDVQVTEINIKGLQTDFGLIYHGEDLGVFTIKLPGKYSALNAAAAATMALLLDVDPAHIKKALPVFQGVGMRFQEIGRADDTIVIHDYAHHPRELVTAVEALRAGFGDRRMIIIFQPHRYTRTRDQLANFAPSLDGGDIVVVSDIYAAGEQPLEGVSAEAIFDDLLERGNCEPYYVPDKKEIAGKVKEICLPGDLIVHLGAGDIWQVARWVLEEIGGE
ncbi:MAG: UDP-N-acetylmuramate--L-alanine ligase [bacterium]|nr:UDP-N-acetylmuramate--L-alanine ligase [bacterium]